MLKKFPKNIRTGNFLLVAVASDLECDKCSGNRSKSSKRIAYYVNKAVLEKDEFIESEHKILRAIKCDAGDECYNEVTEAMRIQFQRFIDRDNLEVENQHLLELLE